jgi:outer membrane lipoprotein SlyB
MKRLVLASAIASSVALSGCATNPYGYNNGYQYDSQGRRVATGAVIGGASGAVAGAVLPGVNPVTGAVVGAVLGGVIGAVVKGKQYYRDTRGYCYYVDQYGNPNYDYNVRC